MKKCNQQITTQIPAKKLEKFKTLLKQKGYDYEKIKKCTDIYNRKRFIPRCLRPPGRFRENIAKEHYLGFDLEEKIGTHEFIKLSKEIALLIKTSYYKHKHVKEKLV